MRFSLLFITISTLFFLSCKTNKANTPQSASAKDLVELVLLLEENVVPSDIDLINTGEAKRISRSQNKWMIKLTINEEEWEMLQNKMRQDSRVIEIIDVAKEEENTTSKNTKSGVSKPVKNKK